MNKITSSRDFLKNFIAILYYVLCFFTPLIFVLDTNELFEFPKTFFIYIMGTTIGTFFLILYIWRPFKLPVPNRWVMLFLSSYIVSTIFSTHYYTSIWGYYSRFNGGLASVMVGFVLYYVLTTLFERNFIRKLFIIAQLTIIPIGVYAIYQHLFLGISRAYSTFGQPNWLSAYICICLPFIFPKIHKIFWFVVGFIGFCALWFSYSLSGFFAVVTLSVFFYFMNKEHVWRHSKIYGLYILVCFVVSISNPGLFSAKIYDFSKDIVKMIGSNYYVYSQPLASVPKDADYKVTDSGFIRTGMWLGSIKLATTSLKNFVIGTGPETFPYEFQPYRPLDLNYSSEWDYILNKPHNYFVEILVEKGVVGLFTYMLLLIWMFKKKDPILTPALIGLCVSNFFGWPTASVALLFWLFNSLMDADYDKDL